MTNLRGLALLTAVAASMSAAPSTAQISVPPSSGLEGTVGVITWRDIPFRTVVRQQFDFSCGSAALATLLTYQYGLKTSETDAFKRMYAVGDQAKIRKVGFSMLDMKRYLAERGVDSDGFRMSLDEIASEGRPAVALVVLGRYRHFVVIKGVARDRVLVGDPALGLKTYTRGEFAKIWNGIAFMLDGKGATTHPQFNARSDWDPWSRAPLDAVQSGTLSLAELSRNLAPIYQLTPVLNVPGAPATNGVP